MTSAFDNDDLEELLTAALGSDSPEPDFSEWKRKHPKALRDLGPAVAVQRSDTSASGSLFRKVRQIMTSRSSRFAVAAAAVVLLVLTPFLFDKTGSGVALGAVLKKLADVQSLHVVVTQNGKRSEIWIKNPDKTRFEEEDGSVRILNGDTLWEIRENGKKATRMRVPHDAFEPSPVESFLLGDDFSGFLAAKPVERVRRKERQIDVYRALFMSHGKEVRSEAFVDVDTGFLRSLKIEGSKDGDMVSSLLIRILEVNPDLPDSMFEYTPPEGTQVRTQKTEKPQSDDSTTARGATFSGTIVWAESAKPVVDARLTFFLPSGNGDSILRARTGRDGAWQISGVPSGLIEIHVRSWEYEWPTVPLFKNNQGSSEKPAIRCDGRSRYENLDFAVYHPENAFSRVQVDVVDEAGRPVKNVRAYLAPLEVDKHPHGAVPILARPDQPVAGADGRFDDKKILPTQYPVRVVVVPDTVELPPDSEAGFSDPFTVEPKKTYKFKLVPPFGREKERSVGEKVKK